MTELGGLLIELESGEAARRRRAARRFGTLVRDDAADPARIGRGVLERSSVETDPERELATALCFYWRRVGQQADEVCMLSLGSPTAQRLAAAMIVALTASARLAPTVVTAIQHLALDEDHRVQASAEEAPSSAGGRGDEAS